MAKLQDKFFNRIIEGELELDGHVKGDLELESGGKAKIFENIVDKDGHPRFIEDDLVMSELCPPSVSKTYGKWALSGSHLLIVLGLDITASTVNNGAQIAFINIPDWIKDKIVALWDNYYVESKGFTAWADNWSSSAIAINLVKDSYNNLVLYVGSEFTTDNTKHVRIAFDLLIDNE